MMKIELDLRKTLQQNISSYFDESKKAKAKLDRLGKAIVEMKQRIASIDQKNEQKKVSKIVHKKRSKEWFEKFHWFHTSDNLLCIAGRDAQSNEQLVKKQLSEEDLYFHADIQGAAPVALKTKQNTTPSISKSEAAQFAALWSKAWNANLGFVDVYSVLPSQVSKQAPSGESMGTGAFMIYGQREWFRKTPLRCVVGVEKIDESHRVISGPLSAIKIRAAWFVELIPGKLSKNALAKQLGAQFSKKFPESFIPLDEWISMMPNGESEIVSN